MASSYISSIIFEVVFLIILYWELSNSVLLPLLDYLSVIYRLMLLDYTRLLETYEVTSSIDILV